MAFSIQGRVPDIINGGKHAVAANAESWKIAASYVI
jgi:hypothetical protein